MGTWVIEVTEVRSDLRGHLEVTMTSKAMKMAVRFNMDIVFRVIEVTDFKSEVKFDL